MFTPRTILVAILILTAAPDGRAQFFHLTVSSNPSIDDVRTMLRSGDNHLVAWGAYFASKNGDDGAVTLMVQILERWPSRDPASNDRYVISEILYALIERNEVVPEEAVSAIASQFPDQAEILAARLPVASATPLLESWYYNKPPITYRPFFPRIAAMLLAKNPPPGFAASVLANAEDQLQISVQSDPPPVNPAREPDSGAPVRDCKDKSVVSFLQEEGWPPLFRYTLEEGGPSSQDDVAFIEEDGDTISWRRYDDSVVVMGCYLPAPLNKENRHHLLVEMAGADSVQWHAESDEMLIWKNNEQFTHDLENRIHSEELYLRATVQALYAKGLLTKHQADSAHIYFAVTLHDERSLPDAYTPLPEINNSHAPSAISPSTTGPHPAPTSRLGDIESQQCSRVNEPQQKARRHNLRAFLHSPDLT